VGTKDSKLSCPWITEPSQYLSVFTDPEALQSWLLWGFCEDSIA
jgi:hypothetical protein